MANLFDTTNAPKVIPRAFVKGDYVSWRLAQYSADYPPASYSITYNFRRDGEPSREFTVQGAEDSGDYLFELEPSETNDKQIEVGAYAWDLYIEQNSDNRRITVDQGLLRVVANKADDSSDPRAFPRKMIAEIQRAILGRATNNQLDILASSIGLEENVTRDTEKLKQWLQYFEAEQVAANRKWRARQGRAHSGQIKARL